MILSDYEAWSQAVEASLPLPEPPANVRGYLAVLWVDPLSCVACGHPPAEGFDCCPQCGGLWYEPEAAAGALPAA